VVWERDYSSVHRVQIGSEVHLALYSIGTRALSQGVKRPKRESLHSPPTIAVFKNAGAILPLTYIFSWHAA
jgi:hypothetical protein